MLTENWYFNIQSTKNLDKYLTETMNYWTFGQSDNSHKSVEFFKILFNILSCFTIKLSVFTNSGCKNLICNNNSSVNTQYCILLHFGRNSITSKTKLLKVKGTEYIANIYSHSNLLGARNNLIAVTWCNYDFDFQT